MSVWRSRLPEDGNVVTPSADREAIYRRLYAVYAAIPATNGAIQRDLAKGAGE